MHAIEVNNLSVKYKNFLAVDNLSFSVNEGEIFGLIGPNGAGKTSTLECIEGLRKACGGTIKILGVQHSRRSGVYKNIGVQLQETRFQDNIKVIELLQLYASFYETPADYNKYLKDFELEKQAKSLVKKLSGGQRQRLSIILALIGNPKIVFLDEISTGLDPSGRRQIWDLIKGLNAEGRTILMTTHFMEEAEILCDRVCLMTGGKIKAIGTLTQLVESANLPITVKVKTLDKETEIKVMNGAEIYPAIEKINVKNAVTDISIYKPTLEDVFLKLTGSRLGGLQQ